MRNGLQVGLAATRTLCLTIPILLCALARSSGSASAQTLTTLHSFAGTDGGSPAATLVQASDGNFYGTTVVGGSLMLCGAGAGCGTVFKMTPAGQLISLHSFLYGVDGFSPQAGLVQGSDGDFYGMTEFGGTNVNCPEGCGAVFRITPAGALTILHSFTNGVDGANPLVALVQGSDGNFYGTTTGGGTNGAGIAFRISSAGSLTTLCSFGDGSNGSYPRAPLVQGSDGNFYGTTSQGGTNGAGTVFKISPAGALTTLYTFSGTPDGANPSGVLVQGSDGNFYGTTANGGTNGYGTVFRISPGGSLTNLHSFSFFTDGALPPAGLVQGSDGNFYGTCYIGGIIGSGTVFRITPSGDFTRLHSFSVIDGVVPQGGLVQGSDGNFYGTTIYGGANVGWGTVFRISVPLNPPPNQISAIQLAGTNIVLTIPSIAGESYQLQACDSLASGSWSNVPGASVTNSIGSLLTLTNFVGNSQPQGFYRFAITIVHVTGAADDASEAAYSGGWTTGSNGGWGFGPWTLTATSTNAGNDGFFVGTSISNAFVTSPGIDVGGKSWGLYANTSNDATAYRGFASLTTGSVFSVSMDNGLIDSGNSVGFVLRNGNATTNYNANARFEFLFLGGGSSYAVVDASGYNPIGVPFTGTGLRLVFTLGTNDTYTFTVIDNATANTDTNIAGTLAGAPGSTIDSVALYNRNAGSGPANDAFFNSLQITGP
jgi:uncharacterized repeat protein (TIGR03803 family)